MIDLIRLYRTRLPDWLQEWIDVLVPGLHIALIVAVAWLLNALFKRGLRRLDGYWQEQDRLLDGTVEVGELETVRRGGRGPLDPRER